jgi:uncharacterized protein
LILLDTSGVLAALFTDQRHHQQCASALRAATAPKVLSPFVLAELGYLIQQEGGTRAELLFLDDVAKRSYELVPFTSQDVAEGMMIIATYQDLDIGLADASIVVLANRLDCRDVLTLDERHFRTLRHGRRNFRILPADA